MFESREMTEGSAAQMRRRARRSPRTRFHLQVLDGTCRGEVPAVTEDVSFHGVALHSRAAREPGQLVRITVLDPRSGARLRLTAVVARRVEVVEGRRLPQPAVALALFGNDRETEARWVDLVRAVGQWSARGRSRPPASVPPVVEEAVAPATPLPAQLPAAPQPGTGSGLVERLRLTPFAMHELRAFDLHLESGRAVFLQGPRRVSPGTTVVVAVKHPSTAARFELTGLVTRATDSLDPSECGLDVLFDRAQLDLRGWGAFVRGAD